MHRNSIGNLGFILASSWFDKLKIQSCVNASAFFPFRDSIDAAAEAGVKTVIQPGGSIRDDEVIQAADEHGMALYLSGIRHFLH